MTNDTQAFAEALCPPHHREGMVISIVGQPTRFSPRKPCLVHASQAQQILASPAMAERDARVRAEALREAAEELDALPSYRFADGGDLYGSDRIHAYGRDDEAERIATWLRDRADQQA